MEVERVLEGLGLRGYQAKVLLALLQCGEAKASEISRLSGVPRAKVYSVLDQLANMGLVDKTPGRPIRYKAKEPEEIVERIRILIEMEYRERLKMIGPELLMKLRKIYRPKEERQTELIRVVRVGEPSERETRIMFLEARREIDVISKVFEYYPKVRNELISAAERGVSVKVLLLSGAMLDEKARAVQSRIVDMIRRDIKGVEIRFSRGPLPLRGVIIDPSYDYTSGKAIFVVEDPKTPLYLRDAAVTENPSLVAGMKKYFDLIWNYESDRG